MNNRDKASKKTLYVQRNNLTYTIYGAGFFKVHEMIDSKIKKEYYW